MFRCVCHMGEHTGQRDNCNENKSNRSHTMSPSDSARRQRLLRTFLTFIVLISKFRIEDYICSCSFKPNSLGKVPRFLSF